MAARDIWKRALRTGVIAGTVIIYLALVGMIEKFTASNMIIDIVTLSRVMLALPAFLAGYVASRHRLVRAEKVPLPVGLSVAAGAAAGAVTGAIAIAGVALAEVFNPDTVRNIFVEVTPDLTAAMTFDQGVSTGALLLIIGGGALGAVGAGARLIPQRFRRPLAIGLVAVFLFGLLERVIPNVFSELGFEAQWLYDNIHGSLTIGGAIGIFVLATVIAYLVGTYREPVRQRIKALPSTGRTGVKVGGFFVLLAVALILPQIAGSQLSNVLAQTSVYVLMGLGLNIVVGFAGLLDLGYVAFFAVGAYSMAVLTGGRIVTSLGDPQLPQFSADLNYYAAIPIVILIAAFVGLLIGAPVLRLRGDYLAIVTLGFGEIVRVLVTSDALRDFVGGAQGMRDITDAELFGVSFRQPQNFYYLALVFILLALFVSARLLNSRIGRAWNAMREDEQVAELMGVSVIKYKLLAFAMGGGVGCLSGATFAVLLGSLNPRSFGLIVSITVLAVVILGGMGSIRGVIVGALALIGIPLLLTEFEEFRLLIYGATLVAIMVLRPQGLLPSRRRARELAEVDQTEALVAGGVPVEPPVITPGTEEP